MNFLAFVTMTVDLVVVASNSFTTVLTHRRLFRTGRTVCDVRGDLGD